MSAPALPRPSLGATHAVARPVPTDAAGRSYLEMARVRGGRLWRPLLQLLALPVAGAIAALGVIFAVMGLAALLGVFSDDEGTLSDPRWETALLFTSIAALLPATWLVARLVGRWWGAVLVTLGCFITWGAGRTRVSTPQDREAARTTGGGRAARRSETSDPRPS